MNVRTGTSNLYTITGALTGAATLTGTATTTVSFR